MSIRYYDPSKLSRYFRNQSKVIVRLVPIMKLSPAENLVHQLRVGIRRMRAVLWIAGQESNEKNFENLSRDLRKLGKALGHVRELDVAISDAKKFGISSNKMKCERRKSRRELSRITSKKKNDKLLMELSEAGKTIKLDGLESLRESRMKMRSRLRRALDMMNKDNASLHKVRIAVKKTRYELEAVGAPLPELKHLQNVLGKIHDLEFLHDLAGKNKKLKIKRKLLRKKTAPQVRPALQSVIRQI